MYSGHNGAVRSLAFSPDGSRLATGGMDQTTRIWDLATGRNQTLTGHQAGVRWVQFLPDGESLLSAGADDTVRLWSLSTQERSSLSAHCKPFLKGAVFAREQGFIACVGENAVYLLSLKTLTLSPLLGHKATVTRLALSPREDRLASGSRDCTIRLWAMPGTSAQADPRRGNQTEPVLLHVLEGHTSGVSALAFSPDGRLLASGSHDKTIRLWDLETGALLQVLEGHTGFGVSTLAFSPDGKLLASGGYDGSVRLWGLETGKGVFTPSRFFSKSDGNPLHLEFSPDGRLLAAAGAARTMWLWEVETGKLKPLFGHTDVVFKIRFSPDGTRLASVGVDCSLRLWAVDRVDISKSELLWSRIEHYDAVLDVAFSPDGKALATGSRDETLRLWDTETGESRALHGHRGRVYYVGFSKEEDTIVSVGEEGIKLWDDGLPREPEALREWLIARAKERPEG